MSESLERVAKQLKDTNKKVQLIYAFNGTGKTRLSRMVKSIFDSDAADNDIDQFELFNPSFLYYNAFTEDLFYWENDLEKNADHKMKIQPNIFTDWVLKDQGQDMNVITVFQRYTNDKLTPHFNTERIERGKGDKDITIKAFSEITFTMEHGDVSESGNLKISKGEESNFIWSIFYTMLEQLVSTLNDIQPDFPEATPFDKLECVFIDDPVSSLDDNHLIQVAVDLAQLIKSNKSSFKFIITTHNPLFFNVLCNELGSNEKTESYKWNSKWFSKFLLEKKSDGEFQLLEQVNDSPFAYHLYLIAKLEDAIKNDQVKKYHFNLLRNIFEKTATFLGYKKWEHLLPETNDGLPNPYAKRIVNLSSHSKHSDAEVKSLKPEEKQLLEKLFKHIVERHKFWQEK